MVHCREMKPIIAAVLHSGCWSLLCAHCALYDDNKDIPNLILQTAASGSSSIQLERHIKSVTDKGSFLFFFSFFSFFWRFQVRLNKCHTVPHSDIQCDWTPAQISTAGKHLNSRLSQLLDHCGPLEWSWFLINGISTFVRKWKKWSKGGKKKREREKRQPYSTFTSWNLFTAHTALRHKAPFVQG